MGWSNKGESLVLLDRYEEAMTCYDESIKINDKSAYVLFMKSKLLFDLKKYEESIQFCDKSIKIDPEDSDVLFLKVIH